MAKGVNVKSTPKSVDKLTDKQSRFVEEYLIDLNATQAAIRAGYSEKAANREGSRLLSNVDIQNAIAEAKNKRSERIQVSQDEVIKRLLEVVDIATGKKQTMITEIARHSESGAVIGTDLLQYLFEPSGANKALELLGKHLGMFKDRVDLTTGDQALPTIINVSFSDERD